MRFDAPQLEKHARELAIENAMPPLDGGVPITAADRLAILVWLECGAPE
jgi:hypothetical protein